MTGRGLSGRARAWVLDRLHAHWDEVGVRASIHEGSARARRFGGFGPGALICFPWVALFGEQAIHLGAGSIIGPMGSLSAGMVPGQPLLSDRVLVVGERCVIGRGVSIVAHHRVELGDEVYTGPNVYITDQNHGLGDLTTAIGRQAPAPERPVRIGSGSWLGAGCVVLPGSRIGRGVAVGAGSVVHGALPDHCVAVGSPARVVRFRHDELNRAGDGPPPRSG